MDKAAKIILNSLKCPVCGSQIDIITGSFISMKMIGYNFSCVANPLEYQIDFDYENIIPHIEKERVVIYEGPFQYVINQSHSNYPSLLNRTEIFIKDIDAEQRVIDPHKLKMFLFKHVMFDFANTNREKLVNRIKTILVFQ